MKNNMEFKQFAADLEQLDAMSLKRRAAEDAVKDADSYAFSTRPQHRRTVEPKDLDPVADLLGAKHPRVRVNSQDGIDGLLIHSNEDNPRLVLSDEILEISLADEAEALELIRHDFAHVMARAVQQPDKAQILKLGYEQAEGPVPRVRVINNMVEDVLAEHLLLGKYEPGTTIVVDRDPEAGLDVHAADTKQPVEAR